MPSWLVARQQTVPGLILSSSHRSLVISVHPRQPSRSAPSWGWAFAVVGTAATTLGATRSVKKLTCEEKKADEAQLTKKEKGTEPDSYSKFSFDIIRDMLPSVELPSIEFGFFKAWGQSLSEFRDRITIISGEISKSEGSLFREIVDKDRFDTQVNPELEWDAKVRLDDGRKGLESLPHSERAFLRLRRKHMLQSFAQYIGVDAAEIDERDLPIVGIAASGGGYRAMVNTLGVLRGAKSSGVLDLTSYIAGVSGSCWCLAMLYSLANGDIDRLVTHVKSRITVPFLHSSTLDLLTTPPTNKYLLSGAILKDAGKGGDTSLVDAYGTLVSSRLFVPDDLSQLNPKHLKISNQRKYLEDGAWPMPIYSMIRHDVPEATEVAELEKKRIEASHSHWPGHEKVAAQAEEEKKQVLAKAHWQWFEMSPFEVGSEELGAWIPTYAWGRLFENGKSVERQPELSVTVLNGVFASAFCATLFHYFAEVRPVLKTLGLGLSDHIEAFVSSYKKDLEAIHPFPPAQLPNFVKGLVGQLRADCPPEITTRNSLAFMDAGAYLNVPYVPLFRRQCDVILAIDASADSQSLWFDRAQEYATQRDMTSWPRVSYRGLFSPNEGCSEPKQGEASNQVANWPIQEAQSQAESRKGDAVDGPQAGDLASRAPDPSSGRDQEPLRRVNIWVGSSADSDDKASRMVDVDEDEIMKRDGLALVYYPLVPGEGIDDPAALWSTWQFEYTPDQTEQLIKLGESNFRSGDEQLKKLLRAVWRRKRAARLVAADGAGRFRDGSA